MQRVMPNCLPLVHILTVSLPPGDMFVNCRHNESTTAASPAVLLNVGCMLESLGILKSTDALSASPEIMI